MELGFLIYFSPRSLTKTCEGLSSQSSSPALEPVPEPSSFFLLLLGPPGRDGPGTDPKPGPSSGSAPAAPRRGLGLGGAG